MPGKGSLLFIIGTMALTASAEVHAQDSSDMGRCAELENADARLTCYDEAIGRNSSSRPDPEPAPEPAPEPVPEPVPLTQDVGEEQLDSYDKSESESTIIEGRVTECRKDANNKYYFVFDNGQVWKQRSNARVPAGQCDFRVTITRDTFGYRMQIDGEGKKIRIGRVR